MRTSSSQAEGCERIWDVKTDMFVGDANGKLTELRCVKVAWENTGGEWKMRDIDDSKFSLKADLALLAMGFVHPVYQGLIENMGIARDSKGNVYAPVTGKGAYQTSVDSVFTAGDMRRGQSLVVWAIREGRQCARAVDMYLEGRSELPD